MVALRPYKVRFLTGRQVQLVSTATAEGDKDVDYVPGSLSAFWLLKTG